MGNFKSLAEIANEEKILLPLIENYKIRWKLNRGQIIFCLVIFSHFFKFKIKIRKKLRHFLLNKGEAKLFVLYFFLDQTLIFKLTKKIIIFSYLIML